MRSKLSPKVIAAIGTCGDPKIPHISGQEKFKGEIFHSSQLGGKSAKGKKVVIIGGGASAVEALEFVDREEAEQTSVLARVSSFCSHVHIRVEMLS